MGLSVNEKIVIDIIRSYLFGKEYAAELTDEQIQYVFSTMTNHDIVHIPGIVLAKCADNEKYEVFVRAQYLAALRYEQQEYERRRITELFEKLKIKHVHLKGAVISKYYPEPWHRTSCDIDVLVPKYVVESASEALVENFGYTLNKSITNHDLGLFSPGGIHVELHYDLSKIGISLNEAWNTSTIVPGSEYEYEFTAEMFILYHYAHMAKHFKHGGYGIKAFLDLWIIEHKMQYDKTKLNDYLVKGGLRKFADAALHLIGVWFGGLPSDKLTDTLSDYVFNSGAHGSLEHVVSLRMHESENKCKYIFKRIFLPYENMRYIYPVLEKHKVLIPLYQVKRWITLMKPKRFKRVRSEIVIQQTMDMNEQQKLIDMLRELDLA